MKNSCAPGSGRESRSGQLWHPLRGAGFAYFPMATPSVAMGWNLMALRAIEPPRKKISTASFRFRILSRNQMMRGNVGELDRRDWREIAAGEGFLAFSQFGATDVAESFPAGPLDFRRIDDLAEEAEPFCKGAFDIAVAKIGFEGVPVARRLQPACDDLGGPFAVARGEPGIEVSFVVNGAVGTEAR